MHFFDGNGPLQAKLYPIARKIVEKLINNLEKVNSRIR